MKILKYLVICGLIIIPFSCSDYLDLSPKGTISDEMLNTPEMVEKQIIAAYAFVEDPHRELSPWWYTDIRSGDSYKGGGGVSDQAWAHDIEVSSTITEGAPRINDKWSRIYIGIYRANNALARINSLSETQYPDKVKRAAEMRFLRSFLLFQIKQIFNRVVWVDETMTEDQLLLESNVKYTSQEIWDKIIADFRHAADVLPEDNTDVGRVNKFSATSFLVKALMFSAYEQNDDYSLKSVNMDKLREVVSLINWIQSKERYKLNDDFAKNFLYEFETKSSTAVTESVFAVQSTHDDGTTYGKLNQFSMLNYPMSPEYGCCGFHNPSQNLVNAFKTDPATGLPLFDTYNDNTAPQFHDAGDIIAHPEITVDPRLMHSISFVGSPYKYDMEYRLPLSGLRDGNFYGFFHSLKEVETFNCPCYTPASNYRSSSLNRDLIRWAEVLLWKAEALIQLDEAGGLEEARQIINSLRTRAKNSTGLLTIKLPVVDTDRPVLDKDGKQVLDIYGEPAFEQVLDENDQPVFETKPSASFKIEEYPAAGWTKEYAWNALQWEVRLELALEGKRGFDLVRWGIVGDVLNKYYEVEKTRRTGYMDNAAFTKGKHEYMPIPNTQITYSKGLYQQNPNYDKI